MLKVNMETKTSNEAVQPLQVSPEIEVQRPVQIRIEDPADFLPALTAAIARKTTAVIDVVTDERAFPPITMFEANERLTY